MPAAARAAGVASAVWKSKNVSSAGAPPTASRHELARQLHPVERGVLERMARHPLPRAAARALGRQGRAHLVDRREPREVGADRLVGPHQRVLVRIDETRDERQPAAVDHLGARVAGRSDGRVVADGDDRPVAPGHRGRPRPRRIERANPRPQHGRISGAAHGGEPSGHDCSVAAATRKDVWRAAMFFTATSALIGLSFGVLARTSGISLAMTCAMSLLVFAGGAQFLAIATIASGGSPLAVVLGGIVLERAPPAVRACRRAVPARAALEARPLEPDRPRRVDGARARPADAGTRQARVLRVRLPLFVAWNLGTLIGALAGGAIADPSALGLDAAFPASMLALLAPLLRQRDVRAAALAGAAIALAVTPFTAPGVPILAASLGVLAARLVPARERA